MREGESSTLRRLNNFSRVLITVTISAFRAHHGLGTCSNKEVAIPGEAVSTDSMAGGSRASESDGPGVDPDLAT